MLRTGCGSERFTIGTGVKIAGHGIENELDLVVLARGLMGSTKMDVMFCETSAAGKFDNKDFQRFENILLHFPQAYFAFATLRDEVREAEMSRIRAFARTGASAGKPHHRVVILTGNDLTPEGDSFIPRYHGSGLAYFVKRRSDMLLAGVNSTHESSVTEH